MPKFLLHLLSTLALLFYLVSCSGKRTPDYNPAIGPFDEDGNYVEAWADNPPKRNRSWFSKKKPEKEEEEPKVVETAPPKRKLYDPPKETRTSPPKQASKPKPKPKTTYKPKPKPVKVAPKYRNHKVVKGDTLYGLSRKYGVSVSAIQKANGLSGSNIRAGATLKIPR